MSKEPFTQEEIAQKAYEIWQKNQTSSEEENWHKAIQALKRERMLKTIINIWKWTGLGDKKLWDIVQLLISASIPLLIFFGTQFISRENTKQETLVKYLDEMSKLLEEKLLEINDTKDHKFITAQAKTAIALRSLDSQRQEIIFQFLDVSGLNGFIQIDKTRQETPIKHLYEMSQLLKDESFIEFIEIDKKTQETLVKYFNKMSELFKDGLLEVRDKKHPTFITAQKETDRVLKSLDGPGQKLMLKFLYVSGLNGLIEEERIGILSNARISKILLKKTDLYQANLQQANLEEANLEEADLWDANLKEANLKEINLKKATLWDANLKEANLQQADLRETDLKGAILINANLKGANLQEADLRGAILINANLRGANLKKANLFKANLRGADLFKADLEEADLDELIDKKFITKQQIKSACNWDKAILDGKYYDDENKKFIMDKNKRKAKVREIRQDKKSDPQENPDCE